MTIVGCQRREAKGVGEATGTELYFLVGAAAVIKNAPGTLNVVVRSTAVRTVLPPSADRPFDGFEMPVIDLQPMDDVFAESMARPRFLMTLLASGRPGPAPCRHPVHTACSHS
jgi:hypothetical protein